LEDGTSNAMIERIWAICLGCFAASMLIVGPLLEAFPQLALLPTLSALVLFGFAIWRLRGGLPSRFAFWAVLIVASGLFLIGLQLVPMPATVWMLLPGRQAVVDTLAAANIVPGPMPLSIDPLQTRAVFLYILPALALFMASLSVPPRYRREVAITIVTAAVACALLGLLQRFQGASSPFFLFKSPDAFAKGPFLNRNFFAAQLYCSVPFVAALAVKILSGRSLNRFVVALMLAVYFVTLMAALGASGSRGGLGLAMLTTLLSVSLVWSGRNIAEGPKPSARIILPIVLLSVLLIAQFGLVGLLRIAQTDASSDYRSTMASTTIRAIHAYFPAGSGFGSFIPVYKLFENTDTLIPNLVNNAHNDWLELALEGGLPMMLLMAGFLIWYLLAVVNIWRKATNSLEDLLLKAATIVIFVLLLHSLFDYPLRTRALMGIFAICAGFMAHGLQYRPLRQRIIKTSENTGPRPPRPARTTPYFARPDGGPHG
jgi:O-antigen ligase